LRFCRISRKYCSAGRAGQGGTDGSTDASTGRQGQGMRRCEVSGKYCSGAARGAGGTGELQAGWGSSKAAQPSLGGSMMVRAAQGQPCWPPYLEVVLDEVELGLERLEAPIHLQLRPQVLPDLACGQAGRG
jgi:hypothetical protein